MNNGIFIAKYRQVTPHSTRGLIEIVFMMLVINSDVIKLCNESCLRYFRKIFKVSWKRQICLWVFSALLINIITNLITQWSINTWLGPLRDDWPLIASSLRNNLKMTESKYIQDQNYWFNDRNFVTKGCFEPYRVSKGLMLLTSYE